MQLLEHPEVKECLEQGEYLAAADLLDRQHPLHDEQSPKMRRDAMTFIANRAFEDERLEDLYMIQKRFGEELDQDLRQEIDCLFADE